MGAELIVRTSAFLLTMPGFYADRSLSGMRPARLTRALLPQCSDLIQLARRGCVSDRSRLMAYSPSDVLR